MAVRHCSPALQRLKRLVLVFAPLLLLWIASPSQARSLRTQSSSACNRRLFWFMAITTSSNLEYWRYAKIAVLSAKENSPNLIPVVIFGGAHGSVSSEAQENLVWVREHGGLIYHHNLTFADELQRVVNKGVRDQQWFTDVEGTYMRLDIPLIVPQLLEQLEDRKLGLTNNINQELALYTDADVMFYHEVNVCKLEVPEIMALGPEMDREAESWTELNKNSGVLLINLKGLASVLPGMVRYGNEKDWNFTVMDQSLINEYFPEHDTYYRDLTPLPEPYNYKGYWGSSPKIVITHWHGPKPERCLNCYIEHRVEGLTDKDAHVKPCNCPEGYNELWRLALQADSANLYMELMADHDRYAIAAGDATAIGAY